MAKMMSMGRESLEMDLVSAGDTFEAKMSPWNSTNLEDLKMDSNFAWLLCSLVSAMAWVIYITHYDSRVIGFIITRLLNRFVAQGGYMKVGSFTWSALAGKIMFRDVVYITNDYSVRVQDGWLIFRWWRAYVPKDVSEDLSHSDTRLSLMLNGFELHTYNRSNLYAKLEKLFGLDSQLYTPDDPGGANDNIEDGERERSGRSSVERAVAASGADLSRSWRDLIPVIKVDVSSGRVVFGNRLVPTTLSINVEEAHFVYSTKPAASRLDHFMHFVKCKAENFKVILAPSPKYTGMVDDPPRYMGEGFVVLSSNNVELYYYMDEPGLVPEEPEMLQLANGDIVESAPPIWGMDIKCGKGTDFSYGPWADRQREHLFKFFFPNDCQPLKVTKAPQPGEKRLVQSFDIRLSTLNEATIDILFSKNKETNAVHVNVGPGSYLEVTMPWIVQQDGYTTKITGQLLHLEATTSLQYRSLVESETLEFTVKCHYPIKWNDHQEWIMNFTGCKATANIIYAHKAFFQDMVNDWASKARPDIIHFVPYTWKLSLLLKEFEVISVCNEYNWIDCSSQNQENAHIAFCGDLFDLSFDLPFVDFLPQTVPLRFWIQGESVDLALYLPEVFSSQSVLLALDKNAKILGRDVGKSGNKRVETAHKWRNVCQKSAGWVDCWSVQIVALSINYTYHPTPPLGPPPQADITTPEKEEILLSPMRFPRAPRKSPLQWAAQHVQDGSQTFDPTTLPPDKVSLELELSPSVLIVYGSWLRNFMHLKENIFGDDQTFTDMQQSHSASAGMSSGGSTGAGGRMTDDDEDDLGKQPPFDPRLYRPLEVAVSVTLHDVQAHLVKNCGENDPACPVILLERFGFEMKKGYRETKLQLLLSPATLLSCDHLASRQAKDSHLDQGHLMLSGLQVRGHAMFSDEGRSLDEETLEYAWLLELQLGKLNGKLTTPQMYHLITSLETFALLLTDSENTLRSPHFIPVAQKPGTNIKAKQPTPPAHGFESGTNPPSGGSPSNRGSLLVSGMLSSDKSTSGIGSETQRTNKTEVSSTVPNPNLLHPPLMTMQSLSSSSCASSSLGCGTADNSATNRTQSSLQRGDSDKTCGNGDADQGVKYRMVRVAIDALDLYIVESGTALQIWASPIRIATCNLHSRNVKSGVTGMIPMIQVRQFISTGGGFSGGGGGSGSAGGNNSSTGLGAQGPAKGPPHLNRTNSDCGQPSTPLSNSDMWLEVGIVTLGPLIVEAATSPPQLHEASYQAQQKYLRMHDEKMKKLWFLWDGKVGGSGSRFGSKPKKCGCTGGCAFFGMNRNGPRFFTPSRHDVQEGINIAAFRIHGPNKDPGFGQSILHEGQLVFHTPPYGSQDVSLQEPSRWDMDTQTQEPSPRKSSKEAIKKKTGDSAAVVEKEVALRDGISTPSPLSQSRADKQLLARRFSCTSAGGGVSGTGGNPAAKDVPYSRLLDSPALPPKLDSDSRLDVPETTIVEVPKSSCSDSKLSVDYFGVAGVQGVSKEGSVPPPITVTASPSQHSTPQPTVTTPPQQQRVRETKGTNVNPSDSHHSLTAAEIEAEISQKVQRTVSMSSENHSEAFFSADEDPNMMAAGGMLSNPNVSGIVTWPMGRSVGTSERKFPSEMSIAVAGDGSSAVDRSGNQPHLPTHPRLSSHCSDHEIHTPEHRAQKSENSLKAPIAGMLEGGDGRLRVSESASPIPYASPILLRPNLMSDSEEISVRNVSEKDSLEFMNLYARPDSGLDSSSDSQSVSSTSFISAVSSQEDMTLVNLHMQVNKPIIDSPLLMSCYVNHLSQVKCSNWAQCSLPAGCDAFTVPLFQRYENGKLHYNGGQKVPHFDTVSEGFTSLKMVGRRKGEMSHGSEGGSSPPPPPSGHSKSPTRAYAWDTMTFLPAEPDPEPEIEYDDELLSQSNENGTKISIIVKLKGDMDIMVCPLVLESLQRFVDALTPMMATLHPLTVLNSLHGGCISRVEAANVLKKEQAAYLSHLQQGNSRGGTAERVKESSSKNSKVEGVKSQALVPGVYEESISTQTQGTIMLPKVNITLLQTSVVEEIISFSALDNLRDLTCVSLFAVCFNDITAQFYVSKQAREVVHTFHRPAPVLRRRGGGGIFPSYGSGGNVGWGAGINRSSGGGIGLGDSHQKKLAAKVIGRGGSGADSSTRGASGAGGNSGDWAWQGEPVLIETSEKQQEEVVVSLSISHIHSQLRRLRNESSILKQAVVTAIPAQHSRVLFTCTRIPSPLKVDRPERLSTASATDTPNSSGRHSHREGSGSVKGSDNFPSSFSAVSNAGGEERLGFIMFECGFEGVSLKVVKRSQFVRGGTGGSQWSDDLESILGIDAGVGQDSKVHKAKDSTRASAEPDPQGKVEADGEGVEASGMGSKHEPGGSNASSCVMEFRTVWFNFAAPPRAPITRKLDYTRLDWNLLSTASPAINAWLNPSNRFAIRTVHMLRTKYRRSTGVVACLMAEALDVQGINMPPKSRYGRVTPLAKTLQEDPSCQLCNVLQKYVLQSDLAAIEANLKDGELPMLSTLRQGVIVLSRQWKNVLYTPLLLEHNYKSSGHLKPLNVAIRIPPTMDEEYLLTDGEISGEECEVTDECTMLLNAEGGSMHRLKNQDKLGRPEEPVPSPNIIGQHDYLFHQTLNPNTSPPNPANMHASPNIRGPPLVQRRRKRQKRRSQKKEKTSHQHKTADEVLINVRDASNFKSPVCSPKISDGPEGLTTASSSSGAPDNDDAGYGDEEGEGDDDSLDGGESGAHFPSPLARNVSGTENEDLYSWMAKQQEFMKPNPTRVAAAAEEERQKMKGNWESKLNTMTTDETLEEATMIPNGPSNIPVANYSSSLHLLDAHLIFEPLLTCLGVMPGQINAGSVGAASEGAVKDGMAGYPASGGTPFENWGSNISIAGSMDTMRIDIVVSECGKGNTSQEKRKSGPSKTNGEFSKKGHGKFRLDIPSEMPAFLCEKIGVELDLRKLADTSVDDLVQKHNVLYISRGQLRKHTSTLLNFSVDIRYISQQVNMPLLRLLHQISNMYQNVKETQMELRGQQQQVHTLLPHPPPPPQLSGIIDPKNGSSSDLQEHTALYEDGPMDSVKMATLTPTLGLSNSTSIPKGLSPSASLKSRPQSFAQKFRSTSKSVKAGYMNLSEAITTPTFGSSPTASRMEIHPMPSQHLHHSLPHPHHHQHHHPLHHPLPSPVPPASLSSLGLSHDDMSLHATIMAEQTAMSDQPILKMSGPPIAPQTITPPIPGSPQAQPAAMPPPHCWKTIYYLLDLYATMPETKTITHRFSMAPVDISEGYKGNRKYDILTEVKSSEDVEKGVVDGGVSVAADTSSRGHTPQLSETRPHQLGALVSGGMKERTRLVVFGVARIQRTRLLATLSGLKLEAEIGSLQASLTCRRKSRPASLECSLAGQVGRTMIVLLEGVAPNQQTVVKVTVGKSQALYSSLSRRYKDKNSGLLTVGPVCVDIPQHPVALHGMMTRGSKQLSSTLQELRVTRSSSRISRGGTISEETVGASTIPDLGAAPAPAAPTTSAAATFTSPHHFPQHTVSSLLATPTMRERDMEPETSHLLQPLVMQFSIILQSLRITAALLPSLQAQYKMDQVNSTGVTGSKAKFTIDLPQHSLSFTTKLQVTEANLPSAASIELPKVHVMAEYVQDGNNPPEAQFADGVILRQGSYLSAVAEIGVFEHSLTTDLLNHLVFVQKVFMKEVNEVVQKVYGGEKPVPIWLEGQEDSSNSSLKRLLFSLVIRIKRIQLTATTPTNSAVRLETGAVEFQLSNRVQNVSTVPPSSTNSHSRPRPQKQTSVGDDNISGSGNMKAPPNGANGVGPATMKIFGKAQVDVNLSLGQLIKNVMFEEAEPEFQQFAFFKTRIGLRNAFQDEMMQRGVGNVGDNEDDKEVVLITLRRPLIYIQPLAVDKAILVWLNYRNAYEYWNEQRSCLNKEVLTATQQVFEKVPFGQLTSQLSSPHMGTLFLQLTVDDMGICLPLNALPSAYNMAHRKGTHQQQSGMDSGMGGESRGAVVVTLESTSISACSSGSLVSKGRFVGLCLRFADDFETSLDDWKPDAADSSLTNLCVVSEGTYEVCSRTIAQKQGGENAKWILNVQWQMEGVDIHLDVNVGKQLSALGHTLTTLTGAEEEEEEEGLMQPGGGMGAVPTDYDDSDETDRVDGTRASQESIGLRRSRHLPGDNLLQTFARNPSLDARQRSKLIEKEMNEQAKIINDLRSLGASHGTIEQEMRRLYELEAMVFKDFRRDMIQKLRRQSVKASSIKGKLGLGGAASSGVIGAGSGPLGLGKKPSGINASGRPGTFRSHSFVGSSSPDHQHEMESSPEDAGMMASGGHTGSFESSPHSGPSRSTSLRVKGLGPRVTFSECHNICSTPSPSRQSSLISGGDSELSLGEIELSDGWQQNQQKQFIQDSLSLSQPTEHTAWEDEFKGVELRRHHYSRSHSDYGGDLTDGSVPLLSPYASRDRMPVLSPGVTPAGGSSSPFTQKTQEPNIDFELDVKVLINSGKCVLHTKDPSKEEELKVKMKKERSVSGGIFDFPSSPNTSRRGLSGGGSGKQDSGSGKQVGISISGVGMGGGANRLRFLHAGGGGGGGGSSTSSSATVAHLVDITIFHIPGLDVKVHYESKTLHEDLPMAPSPRLGGDMGSSGGRTEGSLPLPQQQHSSGRTKGGGIKKASLFAWMTLQSIPEETIISPHILEFLEQTLEPIPSPSVNQPAPSHGKASANVGGTGPGSTIFSMDLDGSAVGGGGPSGIGGRTGSNMYGGGNSFPSAASSSSFPVDVIVYFHMQPSTFRFSCLPVSRVECMLQLPSLDIVFSSKRAEEEELYGDHGELGPTKQPSQPGRPSLAESGAFPPSSSAIGGLSVTGCLADFSVYIFHPYGGGKKSGLKEAQWSPLADSERKDSLSVNVEFVKFHLSRSRKLHFGQHQQFENIKGFKGSLPPDRSQAVIRFSTIVDIGSASFKYDMRRLTEILAFPKAWYRRSIVRRLFLGDLSMGAAFSEGEEEADGAEGAEEEDSTSPSSTENKDGLGVPYQSQIGQARSFAGHESSNYTDDAVLRHSVPLDRSTSVLAGTRDRLRLSLESDAPSTSVSRNSSASSAPSQRVAVRSSWGAADYKQGRGTGSASSPPVHQRTLGLLPGRQRRVGVGEFRDGVDASSESKGEGTNTSATSPAAWETLVLFAVNFTKLNVHMNMGNVMGNVMWLTKDFHSEGRLSIGSNGHKNVFIGMGLGGSSLDAKGGIVGGTIELSRIDTFVHIREDPGIEPDHTVGLKLFAVELRLDYMGTGVLMSRVSSLDVSLRDEWKIHHGRRPSDAFVPTKRPAMIFMHGDLGWDQLQLMISKSTTADLLKMFYKLEEFFSQQFKSSKRVFSSLQPWPQQRPSFKKKAPLKRKVTSSNLTGGQGVPGMPSAASSADAPGIPGGAASSLQDARHHRHWQRVLREVGGLCLPTLALPLPHSGTVLGGTMELHGNNISLACFHGINFKSKSWALFSLKEPCISFATEAQEIPPSHEGESHADAPTLSQDVHVVQTLTFSLGMTMGNEQPQAQHHSMATVCRMGRNVLFPPQFRTLQEWFHYAFSGSEIDAVNRFPSLEREKYEGTTGSTGSSGSGGPSSHTVSSSSHSPPSLGMQTSSSERRNAIKLQDPNHTREVIFALPSLQLHLKTEHLQTARTPDVSDVKPVVECSFITEFEDHIFVTVDAEAFFFLHDLITSYVREKERVVLMSHNNSGMRSHSPDPESRRRGGSEMNSSGGGIANHSSIDTSGLTVGSDDETKRKAFDPAEMFQKDWRTYICKTWHLEPTVRLLSWAGKSIEPYGVDYILQKLGFSHARTTIPKWMQRGFMDPLDKVLSMLVIRMVSVARGGDGKEEDGEETSTSKSSLERSSVVAIRQRKGQRPKEKGSSVLGKVK
ncbi:transmembrane protein KIAA1109 isoform X3 [Ischnura elegans]|uniref:transmembrane protein KIAA1109 isoform X3 n=1 Tax=Ischnura elegans TaxID=197161 RepID=UPI001ED89211|nr:transmembrane protein KIAA1109 isoform X3 [Ischnura elegans]